MRVGVDSYSYHRLLGEVRPGESPSRTRLPDGGAAVIAEARSLGADGVSLETCFLGPPGEPLVRELVAVAGPLELVFSWGAPNGLEFGRSSAALADLLHWIEAAATHGTRTLRIVVAGPELRGREPIEDQLARTVGPLAEAAAAARSAGLDLAVENHGDLTAAQLDALLDTVGDPALGVCFDTANALRVGDDVVAAAALLAPRVRMLHVKDVEAPTASTDHVTGPCSVRFGTGVVPLAGVLDLPALRGFDGLVCVEIGQLEPGADERELVADALAWLRGRPSA
jgi:sugar phosphate isomerase/epimerase